MKQLINVKAVMLVGIAVTALSMGPAFAADEDLNSGDWKLALPLAKDGDPLAQCQLGELIVRGIGAHHGIKAAAGWFVKAADKDELCGLLRMGEFHRRGRGVTRDVEVSDEYYARALPKVESAARLGDIERQILLAQMYQRGWGTEKDLAKAGFWNKTAASLLEPLVAVGDVDAHKKLANILLTGIGVKRDVLRAGRLYERAAATGDRAGQFLAGLMWFNGRAGHPVDHKRGFQWLFQAAEQDHPRSQFLVGTGFANGQGVDPSVRKAAKWFKLADDRGFADAEAALKSLEGKGPKIAYNKGIADAEDWLPVHERPDANS